MLAPRPSDCSKLEGSAADYTRHDDRLILQRGEIGDLLVGSAFAAIDLESRRSGRKHALEQRLRFSFGQYRRLSLVKLHDTITGGIQDAKNFHGRLDRKSV